MIFFRAPFWKHYCAFAETARNHGSRIVFDIDDLVFDEELIPIVDGYRLLTEAEKLGYARGVRAYREFLLYADICTAPTEFLADQMSGLGRGPSGSVILSPRRDREVRAKMPPSARPLRRGLLFRQQDPSS